MYIYNPKFVPYIEIWHLWKIQLCGNEECIKLLNEENITLPTKKIDGNKPTKMSPHTSVMSVQNM